MLSCLPAMCTTFALGQLTYTFPSFSSPVDGRDMCFAARPSSFLPKATPSCQVNFTALCGPSSLGGVRMFDNHSKKGKKGRRSCNQNVLATHQNSPTKELGTTATKKHAFMTTSAVPAIMTELESDQPVFSEEAKNGSPSPLPELALRWRELAGQDDWVGLLDPMDLLLRSELIRYGEMAQACYDAFESDPSSRYSGTCKYPRAHFFQSLDLPSLSGYYSVTRYLYVTSNIQLPDFLTGSRQGRLAGTECANWIGYVAVSSDEGSRELGRRDIAVAWRGTVTTQEWLADLIDYLRPVTEAGIPCPERDVMAESGFLDIYTDKNPNCRLCSYSAREQVLAEVGHLVHYYACQRGEHVSVSITGHSLGSALATLSAFDIAELIRHHSSFFPGALPMPITVYSFSGPRVGNRQFKERFQGDLGIKAIRVVNVHDTVPRIPGVFINESVPEQVRRQVEKVFPWWSYSHLGVELRLDHRRSPFLKDTPDPACLHNLEAHLHLLDGYHGTGERFMLATGRDPALVNKASDFLKDHYMVPSFWRQDENKGMVKGKDGRWVLPERRLSVFLDGEDHLHHHPDHETGKHLRELGLLCG